MLHVSIRHDSGYRILKIVVECFNAVANGQVFLCQIVYMVPVQQFFDKSNSIIIQKLQLQQRRLGVG